MSWGLHSSTSTLTAWHTVQLCKLALAVLLCSAAAPQSGSVATCTAMLNVVPYSACLVCCWSQGTHKDIICSAFNLNPSRTKAHSQLPSDSTQNPC